MLKNIMNSDNKANIYGRLNEEKYYCILYVTISDDAKMAVLCINKYVSVQ